MPDWKDPKAYEQKFDRAGWAWEFLRRNRKYRADYALVAKAWEAVPRKGHLLQGGKAFEADSLAWRLGAEWGLLTAIVDPNSDKVPSFMLSGPVQPDGDQVSSFYYEPDEAGTFIQRPEFSTLTFDLRRPLRQQLARARTLLRKRKKGVASIKPVRASEKQWRLYLRVLDAKEAGAKTSEIIAAIGAYKKLGTKVDTQYKAQDRVSDHFKAARKLRDNPLALIL